MLCPYCNEEIKDGAVKCRFCGEYLNKEEEKAETPEDVKVYGVIRGLIRVNIILGIPLLFLSGIGIIFLIGAWLYSRWKLEIHKDCLIIKHGIITKKKEEIPYQKINSVDTKNIFGFVDLLIRTGNDKPVLFKYIQKHEEVVSEIKKHLKR